MSNIIRSYVDCMECACYIPNSFITVIHVLSVTIVIIVCIVVFYVLLLIFVSSVFVLLCLCILIVKYIIFCALFQCVRCTVCV
jgi:hypothetical protein